MSYTAHTSNGNLEIIINYSIRSKSLPLPVTNRKEAKKFSYLVGIPGQHFLGYLWTSLSVDTPNQAPKNVVGINIKPSSVIRQLIGQTYL